MTLPSFLIIGAMKAGSTTLFGDLATHPDVHPPTEKEPGNLAYDDVLTEAGRAQYTRLFRGCRPDQVTFEASTYYTQLPTLPGAAQRAQKILGDSLKVIYIVREPVDRARSHHRHLVDAGQASEDMDATVAADTRLIDYGRYKMQLEPWIATFGTEQIRVIRFEHYIANRVQTAIDTQTFLGLEPRGDLVNTDSAANISEGKELHTPLSRRLQGSAVYQRLVRPLLPESLKRRAKRNVMTQSTTRTQPPSAETVELILEATAADVAAIAPLIHPPLEPGTLPWSPDAARARARGS